MLSCFGSKAILVGKPSEFLRVSSWRKNLEKPFFSKTQNFFLFFYFWENFQKEFFSTDLSLRVFFAKFFLWNFSISKSLENHSKEILQFESPSKNSIQQRVDWDNCAWIE